MMNKKVNILNRVRITDFSFGSSQHYDWSCFCFKKKKKKERNRDFAGGPMVKRLHASSAGSWVWSPIRGLRSHMLHDQKINCKKKRKQAFYINKKHKKQRK